MNPPELTSTRIEHTSEQRNAWRELFKAPKSLDDVNRKLSIYNDMLQKGNAVSRVSHIIKWDSSTRSHVGVRCVPHCTDPKNGTRGNTTGA